MIKRLHHIMIAVKDLDEAVALYGRLFGLKPSRAAWQTRDGYHIVDLPVGDTLLQFIASGKPGDAIDRFLERRGEGLYSIGLEVEDKLALVQSLRAGGVQMIGDSLLHPKSTRGVLTEILAPGEE